MNDETKYWPRLFRTFLMEAIQEGRKNQTRRPLTPRNTWFDGNPWPQWASSNLSQWDWDNAFVDQGPSPVGNPGPYLHLPHIDKETFGTHRIYPRVRPGDVFWPKETFTYSTIVSSTDPKVDFGDRRVLYKAACDPVERSIIDGSWKASIFLRFVDRRFDLPINKVRIERVQDISEEDAKGEGVEPDFETNSYIDSFMFKWDEIYGKRPERWDRNWWVIAYNFDKQEVQE